MGSNTLMANGRTLVTPLRRGPKVIPNHRMFFYFYEIGHRKNYLNFLRNTKFPSFKLRYLTKSKDKQNSI